jgi:hypothetical protein
MASPDQTKASLSGLATGLPFTTFSNDNDPNVIEATHLHVIQRGDSSLPYASEKPEDVINGYDASLMQDRGILSSEEEKRLLRRTDWRLLPLLALMYVVKTIDAANVSNARIMDKGTKHNILTELHSESTGR